MQRVALEKIQNYAAEKGLSIAEVCAPPNNENAITSHRFVCLLSKKIESVDEEDVFIYNVHEIADDMTEFFDVLVTLGSKKIALHFVHLGCVIKLNQDLRSSEIISALSQIQHEYDASTTRDRPKRRSTRGLILGRPTGKKNAKYKLDSHRDEIQKYINFGISVASMSKLLDCHPQTVKRYIIERGMFKKEEELQ